MDISKKIENKFSGFVKNLQNLVRINTVNPYSGDALAPGEKEGQEYLKTVLDKIGFHTIMLRVPDNIGKKMGLITPEGRNFKNRPNLVGIYDTGRNGKTIILNGHMDTVGISGMGKDALKGEIINNKLYGRGSTDCKGNLISSALAVSSLLEVADKELCGKIIFQSVIGEECSDSGAGTLSLINQGYKGDLVISIDGTYHKLIVGCCGVATLDIFINGEGGHAAESEKINAIDNAILIKEVMDKIKKQRLNKDKKLNINIGIFNSGISSTVIPDKAYLSYNIVYNQRDFYKNRKAIKSNKIYLMTQTEKEIKNIVDKNSQLKEYPPEFKWIKNLHPYKSETAKKYLTIFDRISTRILGKELPHKILAGWIDPSWYNYFCKIPVLGFAAGTEGVAHSTNEYIELENIKNHSTVLANYLYELLKKENGGNVKC